MKVASPQGRPCFRPENHPLENPMPESALQPIAPIDVSPRALAGSTAGARLPRPAAFVPAVDRQLAACRRNGASIVVVSMALDGIETIAMRHGPAIVDQLLQAVWHRFRSRLRGSDVTLHLEGAEFGAVLLNAAASAAVSVGVRLPAALSELYSVEALEIGISARVGLAVYPQGGSSGAALVHAAIRARDSNLRPI
jgi:diguanylate cyclase (GGDEF)-like protein